MWTTGVSFDSVLMGCVPRKEMTAKKKVETSRTVVHLRFKLSPNFVTVRTSRLVLFFLSNYKRKEKSGDYNRLYETIKGATISRCVQITVSAFISVEGKIL